MRAVAYMLFIGSVAYFTALHFPQLLEPGFTLHWHAVWLVIVTFVALVVVLTWTRPRPSFLNESEQFDDEDAILPSKY